MEKEGVIFWNKDWIYLLANGGRGILIIWGSKMFKSEESFTWFFFLNSKI